MENILLSHHAIKLHCTWKKKMVIDKINNIMSLPKDPTHTRKKTFYTYLVMKWWVWWPQLESVVVCEPLLSLWFKFWRSWPSCLATLWLYLISLGFQFYKYTYKSERELSRCTASAICNHPKTVRLLLTGVCGFFSFILERFSTLNLCFLCI